MNARYALAALLLGMLGFGAIEWAGSAAGVRTALTPWAYLDAAAFALVTLLLAALFAPLFGRARGVGGLAGALLFVLLHAPLTGVVGGAFDLTASGGWAFSSEVRGAFIATPVNLVLTMAVDLWYVALPLGVASALLLWRLARPRRPARRW